MNRLTLYIATIVLMVAAAAPAQVRPYRDTSIYCILWDICRQPRRLSPTDPTPYLVPRSVGAWSQYPDMAQGPLPWWPLTTGRPFIDTLLEMRDSHDLTAAAFQLRSHPTENVYENIRKAFRIEGVDIIVLWLERWASTEPSCDAGPYVAWQNYPLSVYNELYELYSNQPKAIFLMSYESDNRLHGKGCLARDECVPEGWYWNDCPAVCEENPNLGEGWWLPDDYIRPLDCRSICCDLSKSARRDYMLRTFNERQAAVEAARAAHPGAELRVFHAIEIDRYGVEDEWLLTARDIIPYMDAPPDFIGLSLWPAKAGDVVESFHRVQDWTGLPNYRVFVAEVGARERWFNEQYDRITSVVDALFAEGVAFAMVWSLDQPLPNLWTGHALIDPLTGDLRSGYLAVRELNETYR